MSESRHVEALVEVLPGGKIAHVQVGNTSGKRESRLRVQVVVPTNGATLQETITFKKAILNDKDRVVTLLDGAGGSVPVSQLG